MSAKPRCHECKHPTGPRGLGKIVTDEPTSKQLKEGKNIPNTGFPKKASCGCVCHG